MSGEPQQPFDFTFPTLAPGQAPAGAAAGLSPPANPFGVSSRAQATPQQQQQPLSVQLQQPVQPASFQPLTARSTVVHASSRAAAPQSQQQQGQQQQQAAPKPVPVTQVQAEGRRNKVPLEKGFSQVSWLKLTKSGADLTGGAGRRRDITLEEVRQHRTEEDAWMVLHGKVYNITPYLRYHPGGADILMKAAGKDGTALFNKYHPWVNAAALLEKCLVGLLHKPADSDGEQQQQQQSSKESIKSKLTNLFK